MKGYELYYTSCEEGIEENRGFQIKAINQNITAIEKREIIKFGAVQNKSKFVYKKLSTNRYVFIKSIYVGKDFSGREGNYFEHAIVVDNFDFAPICMYYWDSWKNKFDESKYLNDIEIEIDWNLTLQHEDNISKFIQFLLVTKKYNRPIIIKDKNIKEWLESVSLFFEIEFLKEFSFSTNEESEIDLDIIGIDENSDINIDYNSINYRYLVIDMIDDNFSNIEEYKFYSKYIIDIYKKGRLNEFFEFCKNFDVDNYQYETILKFFYLINYNLTFDEIGEILEFVFEKSSIDISLYVDKLFSVYNLTTILFLISITNRYPIKNNLFKQIKEIVYKKFIDLESIDIMQIIDALKENNLFDDFRNYLFNDINEFLQPMKEIEKFIELFNPDISIKIVLIKKQELNLELYKYVGLDKFLEIIEDKLDEDTIKKIVEKFWNDKLNLDKLNLALRKEIIYKKIINSSNSIEEFFKYENYVNKHQFFNIAFSNATQSQKIEILLKFAKNGYQNYLEESQFIDYLQKACNIISLESLYKYEIDNYLDEHSCSKIYLITLLREYKIEIDVNKIFLDNKDLEWFIKSYLMIVTNCNDMAKVITFWINQTGELKNQIFEALDLSKCKKELENIEGIEEYITIDKSFAKKMFLKLTNIFKR